VRVCVKRVKVKAYSTALNRNPSQSYGASLAISWDHTVVPATRHK